MKQHQRLLVILFALCIGVANVWAETATYTVSSKTAVTTSGTAPTGSSASYSQTYNTVSQITNGNSATLTLSGFAGQKVTGIVLSMKSNGSRGTGTFSAVAGSTTIASIASATAFDKWYDNTSYGTTYRDVTVALTNNDYAIQTGENVVIKIAATVNSLYIQSYTITYESAGSSCTKPTFTIEDKTISLAEASAANYDLSALTTNKGGSTGAITYVCDDASVMIDGSTFYTETPGTYTITATMAADETYCEATTTFTITVQSAPCTQLAAPTGMNASATAYNAATLTWTAVENATKYQVTITPNGGTAKTAEATETTYNATDLTSETTYTWTVKAIGDGTTYCDSEESTSGTFTTPAKPKYTIIWSTPAGTSATQVTQGDKVGTLPADPAAPVGCSDKVFMGWSATNIGTTGTDNAPDFITAETVPAGDVTYYAVFATETKSSTVSGSLDITISNFTEITTSYTTVFTHTYTDATVEAKGVYKNSNGIQMNSGKGTYIKNTTALPGPITNITCTWSATGKNSPTLYVAKGGVASTSSTNLGQQSNASTTQSVDVSASEGYDYFYFDGTTVTGACHLKSLKITYGGASTTYTDYVTNCAEPTEPIITTNISSMDFGTILQGEATPDSKTLIITGKNLTSNIIYAQPTHFTVAGALTTDGGTLTITPKTDEAGTFTEDLTLTSTGATAIAVQLSVIITPTYTIQWSVCGDIDATLTTTVAQGAAITLPADPTKDGLVFFGWTTEENKDYQSTDQAPDIIGGTITATANTTYYAVFAQSKGNNTGYTKVTEARNNYAGKYLIVSEDNNVAFNGSLTTLDVANNNIAVTITDGKIAQSETLDNATFTIAKTGDAYTIQSQSGIFIGKTANSNGMDESTTIQYTNTITLTDGSMVIKGSGGATLRYNPTDKQERFRYFKSASYGDPFQLYEKADLFNYNTNCTAVEIYSISASSTTGGEITVSHTNAIAGELINITVTPEERYRLDKVVYNDGADHNITITNNKGSFTMPAANVTITATFAPIPVTDITVSPTAVNLRAGQSQALTITIAPDDAFNQSVQWHSSNATVATVSVTAEGTFVVAHSEGSAILTATTQDGSNLTATVNATITAANTYTYVDALHGNATQVHAGKHTVPAFSNQREGEGMECTYLHYHFIGWTKGIINSDTDKAPTDLLKPGETVDANEDGTSQTYYAVWAEATTK